MGTKRSALPFRVRSSAATAWSTAAGSSPTTAASTAAGPDATSTASGHSISDLVGTGGEISTATMPTAKPEWIARVQPLTTDGAEIDAKSLNLVALYPCFTMDGGRATADNADLKALGVTSATAYKGVTTYLRESMGALGEWQGPVFHS